jgi:hypothetical protein
MGVEVRRMLTDIENMLIQVAANIIGKLIQKMRDEGRLNQAEVDLIKQSLEAILKNIQ